MKIAMKWIAAFAVLLTLDTALADTPAQPGARSMVPAAAMQLPSASDAADLPPANIHGWVRQIDPATGRVVNTGNYPVFTVVLKSKSRTYNGQPLEARVGDFGAAGSGTHFDQARNAWPYQIVLAPDLAVSTPASDPERGWTARFNPNEWRYDRVEVEFAYTYYDPVAREQRHGTWRGTPRNTPFADIPN